MLDPEPGACLPASLPPCLCLLLGGSRWIVSLAVKRPSARDIERLLSEVAESSEGLLASAASPTMHYPMSDIDPAADLYMDSLAESARSMSLSPSPKKAYLDSDEDM